MTQQAVTTEASAPAQEASASTTIDERMSALAEALTPVGEESDYAQDAPVKAKPVKDEDDAPAKAEAKDEPDVDAARAERRARREAIRAKEIARAASRREPSPQNFAPPPEVAEMQAEIKRLRSVEESLRDPTRFFEAAAGVGVDPNALSQWLEKAVNDPSAVMADIATKRAKEIVSPELEAMKAEVAAIKRAHEEQIQQARVAQERAAEAEFITHVTRQGADAASAVWREAFGDKALIQLANNLLPELPEGSTMEDLHDVVEEWCSATLQRLSRGNPTKQHRKPEHPAQKNISARARADRTEIDDPEAAMASLSVDERFRLLATQLNNSR